MKRTQCSKVLIIDLNSLRQFDMDIFQSLAHTMFAISDLIGTGYFNIIVNMFTLVS